MNDRWKNNSALNGNIRMKYADGQDRSENNFEEVLSIVHINTHDTPGGAAKVASRLAQMQRSAGHHSKLLVGFKLSRSEHSFSFPIETNRYLQVLCKQQGQLDYELQGSHRLVFDPQVRSADILHLHNLHGGYFNPFSLSSISHSKPTVWTLHDMQAITGHCAHSFDCDKWQTDCCGCQNLSIYPDILVDTSKQLLRDKKLIYDNSYLTIVTPSQWLKGKVENSVLKDHPVELIYNGVDTAVFKPWDKDQTRKKYGIPLKKLVIGASANGGTLENYWKGGNYTKQALDAISARRIDFVFVNVGCKAKSDDPRIINMPHIEDEEELARIYSSIDLFLYTPIADNCPLVVLEMMACGIPIVTFNTGGIPELIRDGENGFIAAYKNMQELLNALERITADSDMRIHFGENARQRAISNFDHKIIASQYQRLYESCIEQRLNKGVETRFFPSNALPGIIINDAFAESENLKKEISRGGINTNNFEIFTINDISPTTPKNELGEKIPAEKKQSIEIPNILVKSKINLPYISIVTPSYNQSKYLEECIDSILSQKYPNLEYIIMDGGSTDGSIEIIKKYEKHLAYWQSRPDGGQYKAIEEGFKRSTGEIMAWINSDDKHHPDSLFKAAYIFNKHADIEWITARPTAWNSQGQLISVGPVPIWDGKEHNRTGRKEHYIQQEATFWKRKLWNKAGAKLNTQLQFAGDFELWVRFFKHAQLYSVDTLLGGFRHHTNQKTKVSMEKYYEEAEQIVQAEKADNQSTCLRTAPEPLPFENKDFLRFKVQALNSQVTENKPGSLLPDNASGYKYDVSIVLSTKDRAQLLDQMLNSLEDAVAGLNYELIVIEGASSDNTSEILGKHGVTKIYNELEHLGSGKHSWSQLYNFGFSKARGKWAMYASDDIIFSKNCITNAVTRLNAQKDTAAGGIFFYKNSMSRLDWDKYGIDFTHGSKLLMNYGLVRLEHFRKVGGLDEIYKFYCADTDLCYKLYQEGLQLIPLSDCFVFHNNVMDVQKKVNMQGSDNDVEICQDRWKHFVPREVPRPRRLLWQEEIVDALNIIDDQIEINQGLEFFWHGVACLQKGYVEEAEIKFSQTLNSKINHWVVLWYLAQGAYQCGDSNLAIKVLDRLIKIKSDHKIAKDLLNKLIIGEKQRSRLSAGIAANKLDFPVTELSSKTDTDSRFKGNVNCLIFSKDRAMQLQAVIESFGLHCKDSDNVCITVLYKASSDKHKQQYQILKERFSDIEFIKETDFKKQTISSMRDSEYILFMVDDNIFTWDFYIQNGLKALEAETDATGFSLRLGKNTNYCYPRNTNQALPDFKLIENGILKYDWTGADNDFGYPLEVSSSIYRTLDIMALLERLDFNNPNILEEAMAANTHLFTRSKQMLLCFENSVTFCNPVNIVQTVYQNRSGSDPEHSAESLTEKFEQGYKIDIEKYSGFAINACHQETELLLIQDTDRTITASKKRDQNIQPEFSIVMTVYNKENFVSDAIESVLKQTFADWELIIVDDCSTDRSAEIISRYLRDNRIKFIRNNINRGISASARIGVANVTSEYFGILDADDCIDPRALEIMHRQHVENPHCGLIYSQFTACDEKLNPIRNGFCDKIPPGNTALETDTVSHFKTFKACDYLKTSGLDENLAVAEDKDIIYKMEEVTHLKFIDEPLYLYREMRNSDLHADGNVNAGIMCRAKAKINALKRRSDATAELMQIDAFGEFQKTLLAARLRHPDVDQYIVLLQKLFENNLLVNPGIPHEIESFSIEEKTQWLAANRYIDFEKTFSRLRNPKNENPQPLVTVDMVTYNGEKYIEKSINSVLSQTYRNFELLIIDDGSTDNTGKIIESYSDKRIRYIRQEHKNYAAGKNRAIKEAKGNFLLCVDSDDIIETGYIEKMVAAALKHPEADYFYPATLYPLDEHGNLLGVKWKYNDYPDNRKLPALLFAHGFALIPNPGSLRRKSLYEKVGLYEEVETVEDFVFLCKNASKINFKRVDENCWYFYRRVPTGNSHRLKPRNKIMADALNEMVSLYGKEGLCPDIADIADPKLREKEYLKYIVDAFEKHSRNDMVHYKEYFLHYADLYRNKVDYTSTATTTERNTDTVPEHTEDQHGEYLVTAIVSTYNSERFIRGCLENLEEQTIADRLQIIVVNSGSEQNEEQIIREFQERFNNIVYIKTHDREGIYKAWNRAVKAARGIFITNANTDDRHRHDSLEIMAETLLKNPDAALVYADQICTDTPNPTFENHHATQMVRKPEYSRSRLLAGCCVGSQPMWRRSLHDEFGWFDESLSCAGDWDFWLRISNKYRLIHIPDFLGIYYHNEHGIEHGRKIHSLYERYLTGKRYGTAYISVIPVYRCIGNPLVSVIIPAYNSGEYIADAIESVLIQNYRNFEIIIIDDGSTDNTKEIIDRFDDETIQYFYQQNKGLPGAYNTGLKNANGDFIIKLDADDMMTPDFIAKHLAEFEIHRDVDLVYTYDLAVSREYKPLLIINRKEYKDRKSLIRDMFRAGFPVIPFRNCIRKSVFEKIGLFDETLIVSEDYDMMKRFVKAGLKAHLLKEAIYIRRMTSDSLSRSSSAKKAKCLIKIIKSFTDTFSNEELFPDVDWSRIPAQTRPLHAKCLTAVTCMSIGQDFVESKVPIYAEKAFEQAGNELNECLNIDPRNDRIRELASQCEYAKQKCTDQRAEALSK